MLNADPLFARPTLVGASAIARAVETLQPRAGSVADMWRLLTENFTVDLDAAASLLPVEEPEPRWLDTRRRA